MGLDIQKIRDSFELAKPIAPKVADKFYEILWGDFPDSKALFKDTKMENQKGALIHSLVFIVDNLENSEKLTKYLKEMGQRHVKYGALPEHYDWVGTSLLKTFKHFLGEKFTPDLESQWALAYTFISETMKAGAAETKPDVKEKIKGAAHKLIEDAVNAELANGISDEVREKIRDSVQKIVAEEVENEIKKIVA